MRLLKHEFSKTLTNRKSIIVLGILLIFYIVMGFTNTYYNFGGTSNYKLYLSLVNNNTGILNETQGEKSTQAYDDAKNKYGAGEAIDHYKMADPVLKFNADYANFATAVDEYQNGKEAGKQDIDNLIGLIPIEQKLSELKNIGLENSYEFRRYQKQLDTEQKLGVPEFRNVTFWDRLFYNWSGMNVLLLLLFPLAYFIAPIFTQEVKTGMDNIVLCAVKGRNEIVSAKIITSIITALVIAGLFIIGTFLGTYLVTGNIEGMEYSIRSLSSYRTAQLDFSIGQFALIAIFWILVVSIVFAQLALFVSSSLKNQAAAFGVTFIILLIGMATKILGSGLKKVIWPIVDFSFNSLGDLETIFGGTTTYNVMGHPVSYVFMGLIVICFIAFIFVSLVYSAQKKRNI